MAEKVLLRKGPNGGFFPATEHDREQIDGIPVGGYVRCNPKQPRNPDFHRKAFALLHMIHENQDMFDSFPRTYDWIKVKAGLVDLVEMSDKGPIYKLQSLSFAEMDNLAFRKAYESILQVAADMGIEVEAFA